MHFELEQGILRRRASNAREHPYYLLVYQGELKLHGLHMRNTSPRLKTYSLEPRAIFNLIF